MKKALSVILTVFFCLSVLVLLTSCTKEGDLVKKVNGMTVSEAYKAAMEHISLDGNFKTDSNMTLSAEKDGEKIDVVIKSKEAVYEKNMYVMLRFSFDLSENVTDLLPTTLPINAITVSEWYVDGMLYISSNLMNFKISVEPDRLEQVKEQLNIDDLEAVDTTTPFFNGIADELDPELRFTKTADGYCAEVSVSGDKLHELLEKSFENTGAPVDSLFEVDENLTMSDIVCKLCFDEKGNMYKITADASITGSNNETLTINLEQNISVNITEEQFPALPEGAEDFIDMSEYYKNMIESIENKNTTDKT
ncbi:MAG: hypothetical protein IKP68_12215 [Clostridia bacterium]|nr:hypothetical protein [Clostridia bacterium]